MRLRRSVLFMPGDSLKKIQKAATLDVDVIVMDLEDGVGLASKDAARRTVLEALATVDFGGRERMVRLNAVDSELFADDLAATAPGKPDGFVVPKIGSASDLIRIDGAIDEARAVVADDGWEPVVGALIESAAGVVHAGEIAAASRRLAFLLFGGEDYAGDVGCERTAEGLEILYARSAVVAAAAAGGVPAIDTLCTDLGDVDGLARDTAFAKQLGFSGKIAVHPRQVEVIHRVFAPSPAEIERARRLVEAHDAHQAAGTGVFELDGRMVDMPMVRAAEKVLARARASGLIDAP